VDLSGGRSFEKIFTPCAGAMAQWGIAAAGEQLPVLLGLPIGLSLPRKQFSARSAVVVVGLVGGAS
jgi:hypothetical protein